MRWISLFLITSVFLFSCEKAELATEYSPQVQDVFRPYEVHNVQKIMQEEGLLLPGAPLSPTHRYVSLQATTEDALLSLKNSHLLITPFSLATGQRGENGTFYTMLPTGAELDKSVGISTLAELYLPEKEEYNLEKLLLKRSGYLTAEQVGTTNYRNPAGTTIQGNISLEYPENGTYHPLRNVSLVAVENARLVGSHTDDDGNFTITGNFFKKIDLYAIFDNSTVQINRLPKKNFLETFFPAWQKLGTYRSDAWGNINISLPVSNPEPWSLGTLNNTIFEYYDFCDAFGYIKPDQKIVMWADENFLFSTSYSTPMLNHLAQHDRGFIADILQGMLGIPRSIAMPLSNLANVGLPDIYTHYFTSQPSRRLREVMFHELTHAAHYMKIGDTFWVKYISYIIKNGGYGTESSPGNGIVAYSEGWAEDLSYQCYKYLFGSYLSLNPENEAPYWIIYGLYYDLYDDNNDGGTDRVSGIQFKDVYDLFSGEVDNPVTLKEKIKQHLSGPTAKPEDIDALFQRHGY